MALPGSGVLSFSTIATELATAPPFSLRSMSSIAGKSTPDAVSEFYGYSAAITYTYHAYWYADDPCNYDSWNIYSGSNGLYYRQVSFGVYEPIGDYTTLWYEYQYYEPLFDGNIYSEITITSNVPTVTGSAFSPC